MTSLNEKYEALKQFIMEKGKEGVLIAFSGGVDSTTLAAVAYELLEDNVVAVTAKSPSYPAHELEEAKQIAKDIGIRHVIVETDELADTRFVENPENRCYYCKTELLTQLQKLGQGLGFKVVFEGTNFSELDGHRPGFKAVQEQDRVFSPWAEIGFTKTEIRALAKQLKLAVHDKPSLACLASRIPFGNQITEDKLRRIERAEQAIKTLTGVRQLRVRDHHGLARIEIGKGERDLLFQASLMDKVAKALKKLGFTYVTLDLEGYQTGSMTKTIPASDQVA